MLYWANLSNDAEDFNSIPATMYLCVLMLTGQGEPEGELDSLNKLIVVFTAVGSVAVFAIPASMLAWGFEAEAERLVRLRTKAMERKEARKKRMRMRFKKDGRAESGIEGFQGILDELSYTGNISASSDSSDWYCPGK